MMKQVAILLATGFEEIEAVMIIDVLRRADINVSIVSLQDEYVIGAHGIVIKADAVLSGELVDSLANLDGVLLPGGMPGAKHLKENELVIELLRRVNNRGNLVGAICAAPIVLEESGIIADRQITVYPGFEEQMASAQHVDASVVVDGNIITGKGPWYAAEFSLQIIEYLVGDKISASVAKGMLRP